jgi:hypothetical protein
LRDPERNGEVLYIDGSIIQNLVQKRGEGGVEVLQIKQCVCESKQEYE